jgi:hypothetical protein
MNTPIVGILEHNISSSLSSNMVVIRNTAYPQDSVQHTFRSIPLLSQLFPKTCH